MGKIKYFHVYGKTTTDDGQTHVVTIVGKLEQKRKRTEIKEKFNLEIKPNSFVDAEMKYKIKHLNRKLTLGMSICHPLDNFDEEVGVEIAKKRIEKGLVLGSLETHDVTMLTEDAILAELIVKLNHVIGNIEEYLP